VDAISNVDRVMFERTSKVSFQSMWPLLTGGLVLPEGLFAEMDNWLSSFVQAHDDCKSANREASANQMQMTINNWIPADES